MAYFDNAATTYPKPECVYAYMDQFYRENGGNAGRGSYAIAQTASALIADTREKIGHLLRCPAKQVVFTPTTTVALNIILQGIIEEGCQTVYISPFEHNAVTRTLHHFEKKQGLNVIQLTVTKDLIYDFSEIKNQFERCKPDLLVVSHASNMCGLVAPVEELSVLAKKYGATVVLDMAQTAGLIDCNVGLESIDFAVFAGHKTLYGPTGISGFVMRPEIKLKSILFGGTGFDSANQDMPEELPEKFEMGTLNISGIAGLNASLKWIENISISTIFSKENENRDKLLMILNSYDFITVVGNEMKQKYVGIVSCLIKGISSDVASSIFDRLGIAVRTGLQCAPLAHEFFGTFPAGTIRLSVNYFTLEEDFVQLRNALNYIEDNI